MASEIIVLDVGCEDKAAGLGYTRVFDVISERIPTALAKLAGQDVILVKVKAYRYDPATYELKVMKKETPAAFQLGDVVTYTNDQGVAWPGLTITGSEYWQKFDERRYFYAPHDAHWYSVPESSLRLERRHQEQEAGTR